MEVLFTKLKINPFPNECTEHVGNSTEQCNSSKVIRPLNTECDPTFSTRMLGNFMIPDTQGGYQNYPYHGTISITETQKKEFQILTL